jgi:hypothetical protein
MIENIYDFSDKKILALSFEQHHKSGKIRRPAVSER